MTERIYPIYHKGHKIYFTDWTNLLTEADAIAAIEETTRFVENLGEHNLLEVIEVTNSISPPKVITYVMECGRRAKPYSKRKALVGISGTRLFALKTVNMFLDDDIKGFETIEEALDWVISG